MLDIGGFIFIHKYRLMNELERWPRNWCICEYRKCTVDKFLSIKYFWGTEKKMSARFIATTVGDHFWDLFFFPIMIDIEHTNKLYK